MSCQRRSWLVLVGAPVSLLMLWLMPWRVMPAVMMTVVMTVTTGIGTGLGLEGGLFDAHQETERGDHVVQHVIVRVAQPAVAYLQRHVPVAQVIGRARQQTRIVGRHRGDRLVGGPVDRDAGML